MQLLSQLYQHGAHPGALAMDAVVPRLWPCFRHELTSVRLAAVRCMAALAPSNTAWLTPELLITALRLTFQNLVMEEDAAILQASQQLWAALLQAGAGHLQSLPLSALAVRHVALSNCMDTLSCFWCTRQVAFCLWAQLGISARLAPRPSASGAQTRRYTFTLASSSECKFYFFCAFGIIQAGHPMAAARHCLAQALQIVQQ